MSVIGIDVGGTKIASAIFDADGHLTNRRVIPLGGRAGDKAGALIRELIVSQLSESRQSAESIDGIGICVPGIYFADKGTVWAPNIRGWEDYPLHEEVSAIQEIKDIRVNIDSDRACYILGETWSGVAQGCKNAIFIAIGTGIGAGILIDGRILRGTGDIAGAIGWMGLDQPYRDVYRSCGCFEYHASGEGISRITRELLAKEIHYSGELRRNDLSSYHVFQAYEKGDELAKRVFDHCIQFWGMAVANMISIFNPEKIVFGGGVFGPASQFLDKIKGEALKWAQPISFRQVSLEVSSLGDDAGLIGAGRLAML
ncbi:ROK family protein [candidate division KSB1 bacterium]|nr:ROK family protein [candidate division KSB1 bacterium]